MPLDLHQPVAAELREPPYNFEAEQALLGAILMSNRAIEGVSDFLRSHHFALALHGRIYEACLKQIGQGQIATPVTMKTYFGSDADLKEMGGDAYLVNLAAAAASIINARDYGELIYDLALRRELIGVGEDMVNDAFEPSLEVNAVTQIERVEQKLFHLATSGRLGGGFKKFNLSARSAVVRSEEAYKRGGRLAGLSTGLLAVDEVLRGMANSDLLILAGRPSMGKTALCTNIAFNVARALKYESSVDGTKKAVEGGVVAFFSLEMSSEQLATRILSARAEIPSSRIREGNLTHDEFVRLVAAENELADLELHIDDTAGLSVSAVRTRCRRLKRTQGLGLIVIDYLQLLSASDGKKVENRTQEVSDITRQLKGLAKELDVPVLALSQLHRGVENRDEKRPQLSDLRESGSIEQDADVVMFVFREQYYLERAIPSQKPRESNEEFNTRYADWQTRLEAVTNTAEAIVAKSRHGAIDTARLAFDGRFTLFSDLPCFD